MKERKLISAQFNLSKRCNHIKFQHKFWELRWRMFRSSCWQRNSFHFFLSSMSIFSVQCLWSTDIITVTMTIIDFPFLSTLEKRRKSVLFRGREREKREKRLRGSQRNTDLSGHSMSLQPHFFSLKDKRQHKQKSCKFINSTVVVVASNTRTTKRESSWSRTPTVFALETHVSRFHIFSLSPLSWIGVLRCLLD